MLRALLRSLASASLALGLVIAAPASADDRPRVVATFTIIEDFVRTVAGDRVQIAGLTPVGAEVHEYELRPRDFQRLERADLVLYNGLGLEQWMGQVRSTAREGTPLVALAEREELETLPIRIGDFEGEPDPHLWMDPRRAQTYVEGVRDALIEIDPDGAEHYTRRATDFVAELEALHEELSARFDEQLPADRRTLITSEAAFHYFADAYGFEHTGIWGTNAEEEGTPDQIRRVIDSIQELQPAAVFWESTISDRYVRSVAGDTDVAIAGPLYVDSLGERDGDADTYLSMMRLNVERIIAALGEDGADG